MINSKQIILNYYSQELLNYDKDVYDQYGIYVKPHGYSISSRKIDSYIQIANIQKYLQCNPVRAIDLFFNIELLDGQSLLVERSWICPNVLAVCTRGYGKSTVIDLEIMTKDMCFCNVWTYIASGTGGQAEQTFTTLERLANDSIDTFYGSTGFIFKNEIEIKNAAGDGFSHSSNGFSYSCYNGAMTKTLNSNIDAKRGSRGSVLFDESGFLSDEMMNVYGAFAAVNRSLKTGKDANGNSIDPIRQRCIPRDLSYQKFYISSASSTDTQFWRLYRDFAKRQIMGDPNYCVLHIDCEQAFKPTLKGELVTPLLSRSTVETEMRTNPEKARREYYCQFSTDAGNDAIIKRGVITRNEEVRKPLLYNDTGDKKFVITYDPARSRDNSVILVGEIYDFEQVDGSLDTRMRLVNCINLIDVGKKIKSPMQTPDQIEYLKKVILDYNAGADAYGNIVGIYIDAGSGGGGVNIADYLMPDWTDAAGIVHRGLIDKEYSEEYVKKFPNAVDKVHLMSPSAYKSEMYEAMIELMNQDKISFTASYDNKDYLTVFDVDEDLLKKERDRISKELKNENLNEKEFEKKLSEKMDDIQSVKTKMIKLDWQDKIALANMDALKEELVNMVRKKRDSGKDSFELTPEKANKLHDDRAYTACMASYALMCERRKNITQRKRPQSDASDFVNSLTIRKARYN
nr:MAG TPA: Terminase large subunit [Bacteriophage sp.]